MNHYAHLRKNLKKTSQCADFSFYNPMCQLIQYSCLNILNLDMARTCSLPAAIRGVYCKSHIQDGYIIKGSKLFHQDQHHKVAALNSIIATWG